MMYRNYISSLLCDNFADSQQLPRLVYQVQSYCIGTSRLRHAATDDTAQYRHINIASGHQADSFLTLYRYFIEHGCSNRHSSRPLCNNPLAFYQCQNSCGNLVLSHSYNSVHILIYQVKSICSRLFHRDSIGKSGNRVKTLNTRMKNRICHTGRTQRLYAIYLDRWFQSLQRISHSRNQSSPTNGNNDYLHIRHFLQ